MTRGGLRVHVKPSGHLLKKRFYISGVLFWAFTILRFEAGPTGRLGTVLALGTVHPG